jgi:hypothetical protein
LPVVSATWETETRGLLEPRSLVPAWATQRNSEAKRETKEKASFIGVIFILFIYFFHFSFKV